MVSSSGMKIIVEYSFCSVHETAPLRWGGTTSAPPHRRHAHMSGPPPSDRFPRHQHWQGAARMPPRHQQPHAPTHPPSQETLLFAPEVSHSPQQTALPRWSRMSSSRRSGNSPMQGAARQRWTGTASARPRRQCKHLSGPVASQVSHVMDEKSGRHVFCCVYQPMHGAVSHQPHLAHGGLTFASRDNLVPGTIQPTTTTGTPDLRRIPVHRPEGGPQLSGCLKAPAALAETKEIVLPPPRRTAPNRTPRQPDGDVPPPIGVPSRLAENRLTSADLAHRTSFKVFQSAAWEQFGKHVALSHSS